MSDYLSLMSLSVLEMHKIALPSMVVVKFPAISVAALPRAGAPSGPAQTAALSVETFGGDRVEIAVAASGIFLHN